MADTSIVIWDTKYEFNWWRPVTAIREADRDGNDATAPDKEWTPLLPTPSFPEYVSGHAAFSGAAAEILRTFFNTDQIEFTVTSDELPDVKRYFKSFKAAAEEIAWSRVYGGIHFWSADKDGLKIGTEIAKYVQRNFFTAESR
jgi:membrane-associated phospholipid phosphatase